MSKAPSRDGSTTVFLALLLIVAVVQLLREWFNFSQEVGWVVVGVGWMLTFAVRVIAAGDKSKR